MRSIRRAGRLGALGLPAAALTLLAAGCEGGGTFSGPDPFELACSIPVDQIFDGGPGRDGIPALNFPAIVPRFDGDFIVPSARVLGIEINGEARAYPLFILWRHEIVNDVVGGQSVLVSYCPLTGSGLAFDPIVGNQARLFGVSGLLFENNLIMFDRESESLWNQLLLGAQCGPEQGTELSRLPVIETSWSHWQELHPQTTVLSLPDFPFSYGVYPYGPYDGLNNSSTLFPSSPWDKSRPPKELVLGVREGTDAVAYAFGILDDLGAAATVNDVVGGREILVTYLATEQTARAFDRIVDGQTLTFSVADSTLLTLTDQETGSTWNALGEATAGPLAGKQLAPLADAYTLFWFSWSVFYPDTRIG